MVDELRNYVIERIDRKARKKIGKAVSSPYLKAIGEDGNTTWVVDVLIEEDQELLYGLAISESNLKIRNNVEDGTPVELQKNSAGHWIVTGRASMLPGPVVAKTYSIADAGLAFSEGWRIRDEGGTIFVTGQGNTVDPGTPTTTTHQWTFTQLTYGELTYGVTAYGAKRATRV